MSSGEIEYYRRRSATERSLAANAPSPKIAAVHAKLAIMYEELVARLSRASGLQDLEPPLRVVEGTRAE